jgi:hypothetical protein
MVIVRIAAIRKDTHMNPLKGSPIDPEHIKKQAAIMDLDQDIYDADKAGDTELKAKLMKQQDDLYAEVYTEAADYTKRSLKEFKK